MGDVSSASTQDLQTFVSTAGAATEELAQRVASASATVNAFYDAPCDPQFRPADGLAAFTQAGTLVADNQADERWLAAVRQAFVLADSGSVPDGAIAGALAAAGINPGAPGHLSVDEPVYRGAVMYSGWSDDPVATGSGNLYQAEDDLLMPPALAVLSWRRCYSSRGARPGANGRGWHTWADTRLELARESVVYHGPDGQVAPFARDGERLVAHPAMEAELVATPAGYELEWRWASRFAGQAWSFGPDGSIEQVQVPGAGTVTFEHRDGRLSGLAHSGGRRLELSWAGGQICGLASSDGRHVAYRYEGPDLVAVQRPSGQLRYLIGADGLVAEVRDADGVRLVRNEYDSAGRVLVQESARGRVSRYRYASPYTLLVGDDGGGPTTLYRHDGAGRLVEMVLGADTSRALRRFDEGGNPVEVAGFDGRLTRRTFDARGNCLSEEVPGQGRRTWSYDGDGRVVAHVDAAGAETVFTYEQGCVNPVRVEGPGGLRYDFELADGLAVAVTDADGVRQSLERDDDLQVVAATDGEGGTTRAGYHCSGQLEWAQLPTGEIMHWEYDHHDRAVAFTDFNGVTARRSYSRAGRLVEEAGPGDRLVSYEWGADGSPSRVAGPGDASVDLGWDVNGWQVRERHEDGAVWEVRRDGLGRAVAGVAPDGGKWSARWGAEPFPLGLRGPLGHEWRFGAHVDSSGEVLSVSSPAGRTFELRWDVAGRLCAGRSPEGPSSFELRRDAAGLPVEWTVDGDTVASAGYTPAGRLAWLDMADGSHWALRYDRAGRPVELDGPAGRRLVTYDSSGRPVRVDGDGGDWAELVWQGQRLVGRLGPVGEWWRRFDDAGEVVSVTEPAGAIWWVERDTAGAVTSIHGPAGLSRSLVRAPGGRLAAVNEPGEGTWRYMWDAAGRLESMTGPTGRTTSYRYDLEGRAIGLDLPDGTATSYLWDADGSLLGLEAAAAEGGEVARLFIGYDWEARAVCTSDGQGEYVRTVLDGRGRPVRVETERGEDRLHWSSGHQVSLRRTDGTVTRADLHWAGMVSRLEHPCTGQVEVERDGAGRLLGLRADGLRRSWRRDANGDAVWYREEIGPLVRESSLTRSAGGRVTAVSGDGGEETYDYDEAGRLAACHGPAGSSAWSYDLAGRLESERGPDGTWRYHYDADGQLVTVDGPDGTTRLTYDERGRRVTERGPAGRVVYRWDLLDRLVAVRRSGPGGEDELELELAYDTLNRLCRAGDIEIDWDGAGPTSLYPRRIGGTELVELPGLPLAQVRDGCVEWLSADWRGSVGQRSVWGGAPVGGAQVDGAPVGVAPVGGGGAGTSGAVAGRGPGHPESGFLGELEVGGLVWLRNRWYDPATRCFLSRDPFAGGLAPVGASAGAYVYAWNDPLGCADPLGLHPVTAAEASAQMKGWQQGHWKEVLVATAAVAGVVALSVLAPGSTALIVPALVGGTMGAGGTVVSDLLRHQPIDWGQVVADGAMGALIGAAAGPLGDLAKVAGANALLDAGFGAATGAAATAIDGWMTDQRFSWKNEALGTAFGGAGGLLASRLALGRLWRAPEVDVPEVKSLQEASGLSDAQWRRWQAGERDSRLYTGRVATGQGLVSKAEAAAQAAEEKNVLARVHNWSKDVVPAGLASGAGTYYNTPSAAAPPAVASPVYPPVPRPAAPAWGQ